MLFVTMLNQLYAPLNFFGTYYRTIQQYMIGARLHPRLAGMHMPHARGAADSAASLGSVCRHGEHV